MTRRTLLAVLGAALMWPAIAQADPYPKDVQEAFMAECMKGGTQELCSCVLAKMEETISLSDLAAQNFTNEQIEGMTLECMAGEAAVEPATGATDAGSGDAPVAAAGGCMSFPEFFDTTLGVYDEDELSTAEDKEVNLDGAGETEVIMSHISCGTSACTGFILQKCEGEQLRIIGQIDGFAIEALDSETNGYKDLNVTGRDYDDDERPFETKTVWSFDGERYQPRP